MASFLRLPSVLAGHHPDGLDTRARIAALGALDRAARAGPPEALLLKELRSALTRIPRLRFDAATQLRDDNACILAAVVQDWLQRDPALDQQERDLLSEGAEGVLLLLAFWTGGRRLPLPDWVRPLRDALVAEARGRGPGFAAAAAVFLASFSACHSAAAEEREAAWMQAAHIIAAGAPPGADLRSWCARDQILRSPFAPGAPSSVFFDSLRALMPSHNAFRRPQARPQLSGAARGVRLPRGERADVRRQAGGLRSAPPALGAPSGAGEASLRSNRALALLRSVSRTTSDALRRRRGFPAQAEGPPCRALADIASPLIAMWEAVAGSDPERSLAAALCLDPTGSPSVAAASLVPRGLPAPPEAWAQAAAALCAAGILRGKGGASAQARAGAQTCLACLVDRAQRADPPQRMCMVRRAQPPNRSSPDSARAYFPSSVSAAALRTLLELLPRLNPFSGLYTRRLSPPTAQPPAR